MPQVALETFHSLTITTFILIFFFFSFIYYYITPFWSASLKLNFKKTLILSFVKKLQTFVTVTPQLKASRTLNTSL